MMFTAQASQEVWRGLEIIMKFYKQYIFKTTTNTICDYWQTGVGGKKEKHKYFLKNCCIFKKHFIVWTIIFCF